MTSFSTTMDHDGGGTMSSLQEPLLLPSTLSTLDSQAQEQEPENDNTQPQQAKTKHEKLRLAITFVAFVIVGTLHGVSIKLVTYPMYNYANFLNLYDTFIFCVLCSIYVLPAIYLKCPTSNPYFPNILESQTELSKKPFALQGSLDFVGTLLYTLSSVHLSGPLLVLLPQSAVPISMVLSKLLLQKTYTKEHWFGAVIVLLGIGIAVAEPMFGSNDDDNSIDLSFFDLNYSNSSPSTSSSFIWSSVVILAMVPLAISSIYKESYSEENEIDPIYWNLWICTFQTIYSIIFAVPAGYISEPRVPANEFLENFWGGFRCTLGYDTYNNDTDGVDVEDSAEEGGLFRPDNCHVWGPLYFTLFSISSFGFNILEVLLLTYGGADIMFLAMALILPISDLAFAIPFMPNATTFQVYDIVGLLVIMGGLFVYGYGESIQEEQEQEENAHKNQNDHENGGIGSIISSGGDK